MQITQVFKMALLILTSDSIHDGLNLITKKIIEEAITTTDPDIIGISSVLDAEDEENSEGMCNLDHEAASPYTIHTAVLPKPSLFDANHPSFRNCIIDTSDSICDGLNFITEKIIEEAITTTDPDIICISSVLDAEDEENSEGMCNFDHEAASPYTIHTAVLPKPSLIDSNINSAIMAMLDIVQPKNDDTDEDVTNADVLPHEKYAQNQPIIPVSRESNEPIVE